MEALEGTHFSRAASLPPTPKRKKKHIVFYNVFIFIFILFFFWCNKMDEMRFSDHRRTG